MTIVLHYLDDSRVTRVHWLLEELEVPYDAKVYKLDPATKLAPAELLKVHPSGHSPVIVDDGETYAESGHIIEHVLTKYGKESDLIWKDASEENMIKYALYSAESNILISGLMVGFVSSAVKRSPAGLGSMARKFMISADSKYAVAELERLLESLQSQITSNDGFYCGGRLTAADIMYYGTVVTLERKGAVDDLYGKYPGISAWMDKLNQIPSLIVTKHKEKEYKTWNSPQSA